MSGAAAHAYFIISPHPTEYPAMARKGVPNRLDHCFKFGHHGGPGVSKPAYKRANPSFYWCDIEIAKYNPPKNFTLKFAKYLEVKVIDNFMTRTNSNRVITHVPNNDEWFYCVGNENNFLDAVADLQSSAQAQASLINIIDAHIDYLKSTIIPDPDYLQLYNNPPQNPTLAQATLIGHLNQVKVLFSLVPPLLQACSQAATVGGNIFENLEQDLNWMSINVDQLVRVRSDGVANSPNDWVRFANQGAAVLFFNHYVQTN